jgi:hypothetical protein
MTRRAAGIGHKTVQLVTAGETAQFSMGSYSPLSTAPYSDGRIAPRTF